MIHRYSPIFTDIHGYSQIFTDIHVILLHWWFWWVQNCPSCQEIPFGVSDRSVHAGGRFREPCGELLLYFVTLCYLYILVYLYMKRSESTNCEETGKVSRSAVSLQSLSDKVLSRVQSPPCHASPSSIFYSQPAPYSPHILGSHRGIRGVQGDPMAIHGYPILIILWRPRRSIDWGSTGRWSWPWLFLASDSTWKSDIPSVRSKACWDGEGARADLTKLCRNSWGFRRFVFWSQEFLNMF